MWKSLLFLVGGTIVGYLLLVLVFCLPLGRIYNNTLKSATSFNGEYTVLVDGVLATRADDFTDALMILTAANGHDRNPFTGSIYAYHSSRSKVYPHALIADLENPENTDVQYSRYWHGYLLFLKPLLMFFTYSQIQILISFAVVALVIGVIYMLQKKGFKKYIIPYSVVVALMSPVVILISMQFFAIFAIFNLATLFILWQYEKILKNNWAFYMFLVIGMATCYFDFLTYPIVALGIPLTVWLIVSNHKKAATIGKNVLQIIINSIGWAVGYFGIWIGKWAWGSLVTGKNLFESAMSAAESRASASAFSEEISRLTPIKEAFKTMFINPVWVILILAITITIILLIMKKIRINREKVINNLWMFVVAAIPLAWYVVFANHSVSHIFFTFRSLSVLVFAVACYVCSIIERPKAIKIRKKNG